MTDDTYTRSSPLETGAHLLAQVIEESPGVLVSVCGPLLAMRFEAPPSSAHLEQLGGHVTRLLERWDQISLLMLVNTPQAPDLDHALIVASEAFASSHNGKVVAHAFVLTGASFSSTVIREWGSAFADAGEWPARSFASLEGACGWVARRPGQAVEINRPRKLFEALAPTLGVGN